MSLYKIYVLLLLFFHIIFKKKEELMSQELYNPEENKVPRKYKRIYYRDRLKIINMVKKEKMACAAVSRRLNISPSTIKMILRHYEKHGKVFEKKADREKRELIEKCLKEKKENNRKTNECPKNQIKPMVMNSFCVYPIPNSPNFYFWHPYYQPYPVQQWK